MPVYRYKKIGLAIKDIKAQVPPADAASVSAGSIGPTQVWDITAPTTSLDDINDFMASRGWSFDSTDPSETPAEQSASDQDHGNLTGLADDDHSQYHNDSRGDARYAALAHASAHQPGGGDAMAVDAAAATGSLRTIGTGAQQSCAGNDYRLSDSRTPLAHAASHLNGGSDHIHLDDLAAPDDNTDLNATTSAHGLLPKLGGGTTNFLRADGSWAAPAAGVFGTEYNYQEKTTLQTTTSTSWQQYTRLTTPSLPAGTYRIGWMTVWNYSDPADEWHTRLQVDDTTDLINPGDGTYPFQRHEMADGGSDQRYVTSGFRHITLTAGVHNIDLDFKSDETSDTARMYHGQIELWRVS